MSTEAESMSDAEKVDYLLSALKEIHEFPYRSNPQYQQLVARYVGSILHHFESGCILPASHVAFLPFDREPAVCHSTYQPSSKKTP